MFVLRLLAVIVAIAIGAGIVSFVLTRNPRYLAFSWRLFRYALIFALLIFALMILERVAAIV